MARLDPIREFREDHRKVRDLLLELASAVESGDIGKARGLLGEIDTLVGPHFRYEEEALYPAMREFLGEYVDSLLREHEGVITTARTAASLLAQPSLSAEQARAAASAARSLLVHVSNCEGLNILVERLSAEQLEALARRYEEARAAGVPLLRWAEEIRQATGIA